MLIDLHVHTNASDGIYPPASVVNMAAQSGISVLAVADHDTVNGIDEAIAAASARDLMLVPAVEINCYSGDIEHHILGYFIDHRDAGLRSALARLQEARIERMHVVISKLSKIGISLMPEEILALAERGVVGRPHIAQAMVRKGYAASVRAAFDTYLGEGKPAYAPRSKLAPTEAIRIIKEARGLPVLAHPGLWGGDEQIPKLAEWGIVGIEVYSPDHKKAQVRRYLEIARDLNLIATGGSDFHGWGDAHSMKIGMVSTPPEEFARLEELHHSGKCKV